MRKIAFMIAVVAIASLSFASAALAAPGGEPGPRGATGAAVGIGELYHDGSVVGTVVPPAAIPGGGSENFYAVPNQRPVVATAPGDVGYQGGKWAFHSVTWNVAPYSLTSEGGVLAAASAGDISITRVAAMDFKCPVQL